MLERAERGLAGWEGRDTARKRTETSEGDRRIINRAANTYILQPEE
jgi:hypothetical protein